MVPAHSSKALLCMITQVLERGAYYGTRALLVIYMIDVIGLETAAAISLYGTFTLLFYLAKLFGGLLGDLGIGNRLAFIIGQSITTIGILCLLIPNLEGIYLAIGFIAVGAGMASTNLFAEIGKEYSGKSRNIESGMTLYYAMTNLGAYIGIFIAVIYADYKTGFCLMAILSAGSLISYVLIPKETVNFGSAVLEEKTKKERPITLSGIGISATIVIGIGAIIYWNCFEYVGGELTLALHTLNNFSGIQDVNISILYTNTNAFVVIISGTILTFLYLNKKFSPFIKAGIGLIMFAIALVCFSFLIQSDVNIFTVIILSQILFSISEILIAPTLLSFYVKKIPKNRLAFAIGIGSVVTMLAMKIVSNMQNYSSEATSNFLLYSVPVIILLVAIGVPFLFFDKLFAEKEPTPEEGSGYDDEFDFNDDIV